MIRGNHRQLIFLSNPDRDLFLQTLGQACDKTGSGSETFGQELPPQMSDGAEHYGVEIRESGKAKARRHLSVFGRNQLAGNS